jgi:16S rRNA processing protein RimM
MVVHQEAQKRRRSAEDVASSSIGAAPTDAQVKHLIIGQVIAPRGVRGELRVEIKTDDPARFMGLSEVYLGDSLTHFVVERARLHQGHALLELQGLQDRNTAEQWRGALVRVEIQDALPLEKDEYYYHQIVGLTVSTVEGQTLGRVTEILPTGANDVYVVHGAQGEILLPAIKEVIVRVDLAAGSLVVRLPDGLL